MISCPRAQNSEAQIHGKCVATGLASSTGTCILATDGVHAVEFHGEPAKESVMTHGEEQHSHLGTFAHSETSSGIPAGQNADAPLEADASTLLPLKDACNDSTIESVEQKTSSETSAAKDVRNYSASTEHEHDISPEADTSTNTNDVSNASSSTGPERAVSAEDACNAAANAPAERQASFDASAPAAACVVARASGAVEGEASLEADPSADDACADASVSIEQEVSFDTSTPRAGKDDVCKGASEFGGVGDAGLEESKGEQVGPTRVVIAVVDDADVVNASAAARDSRPGGAAAGAPPQEPDEGTDGRDSPSFVSDLTSCAVSDGSTEDGAAAAHPTNPTLRLHEVTVPLPLHGSAGAVSCGRFAAPAPPGAKHPFKYEGGPVLTDASARLAGKGQKPRVRRRLSADKPRRAPWVGSAHTDGGDSNSVAESLCISPCTTGRPPNEASDGQGDDIKKLLSDLSNGRARASHRRALADHLALLRCKDDESLEDLLISASERMDGSPRGGVLRSASSVTPTGNQSPRGIASRPASMATSFVGSEYGSPQSRPSGMPGGARGYYIPPIDIAKARGGLVRLLSLLSQEQTVRTRATTTTSSYLTTLSTEDHRDSVSDEEMAESDASEHASPVLTRTPLVQCMGDNVVGAACKRLPSTHSQVSQDGTLSSTLGGTVPVLHSGDTAPSSKHSPESETRERRPKAHPGDVSAGSPSFSSTHSGSCALDDRLLGAAAIDERDEAKRLSSSFSTLPPTPPTQYQSQLSSPSKSSSPRSSVKRRAKKARPKKPESGQQQQPQPQAANQTSPPRMHPDELGGAHGIVHHSGHLHHHQHHPHQQQQQQQHHRGVPKTPGKKPAEPALGVGGPGETGHRTAPAVEPPWAETLRRNLTALQNGRERDSAAAAAAQQQQQQQQPQQPSAKEAEVTDLRNLTELVAGLAEGHTVGHGKEEDEPNPPHALDMPPWLTSLITEVVRLRDYNDTNPPLQATPPPAGPSAKPPSPSAALLIAAPAHIGATTPDETSEHLSPTSLMSGNALEASKDPARSSSRRKPRGSSGGARHRGAPLAAGAACKPGEGERMQAEGGSEEVDPGVCAGSGSSVDSECHSGTLRQMQSLRDSCRELKREKRELRRLLARSHDAPRDPSSSQSGCSSANGAGDVDAALRLSLQRAEDSARQQWEELRELSALAAAPPPRSSPAKTRKEKAYRASLSLLESRLGCLESLVDDKRGGDEIPSGSLVTTTNSRMPGIPQGDTDLPKVKVASPPTGFDSSRKLSESAGSDPRDSPSSPSDIVGGLLRRLDALQTLVTDTPAMITLAASSSRLNLLSDHSFSSPVLASHAIHPIPDSHASPLFPPSSLHSGSPVFPTPLRPALHAAHETFLLPHPPDAPEPEPAPGKPNKQPGSPLEPRLRALQVRVARVEKRQLKRPAKEAAAGPRSTPPAESGGEGRDSDLDSLRSRLESLASDTEALVDESGRVGPAGGGAEELEALKRAFQNKIAALESVQERQTAMLAHLSHLVETDTPLSPPKPDATGSVDLQGTHLSLRMDHISADPAPKTGAAHARPRPGAPPPPLDHHHGQSEAFGCLSSKSSSTLDFAASPQSNTDGPQPAAARVSPEAASEPAVAEGEGGAAAPARTGAEQSDTGGGSSREDPSKKPEGAKLPPRPLSWAGECDAAADGGGDVAASRENTPVYGCGTAAGLPPRALTWAGECDVFSEEVDVDRSCSGEESERSGPGGSMPERALTWAGDCYLEDGDGDSTGFRKRAGSWGEDQLGGSPYSFPPRASDGPPGVGFDEDLIQTLRDPGKEASIEAKVRSLSETLRLNRPSRLASETRELTVAEKLKKMKESCAAKPPPEEGEVIDNAGFLRTIMGQLEEKQAKLKRALDAKQRSSAAKTPLSSMVDSMSLSQPWGACEDSVEETSSNEAFGRTDSSDPNVFQQRRPASYTEYDFRDSNQILHDVETSIFNERSQTGDEPTESRRTMKRNSKSTTQGTPISTNLDRSIGQGTEIVDPETTKAQMKEAKAFLALAESAKNRAFGKLQALEKKMFDDSPPVAELGAAASSLAQCAERLDKVEKLLPLDTLLAATYTDVPLLRSPSAARDTGRQERAFGFKRDQQSPLGGLEESVSGSFLDATTTTLPLGISERNDNPSPDTPPAGRKQSALGCRQSRRASNQSDTLMPPRTPPVPIHADPPPPGNPLETLAPLSAEHCSGSAGAASLGPRKGSLLCRRRTRALTLRASATLPPNARAAAEAGLAAKRPGGDAAAAAALNNDGISSPTAALGPRSLTCPADAIAVFDHRAPAAPPALPLRRAASGSQPRADDGVPDAPPPARRPSLLARRRGKNRRSEGEATDPPKQTQDGADPPSSAPGFLGGGEGGDEPIGDDPSRGDPAGLARESAISPDGEKEPPACADDASPAPVTRTPTAPPGSLLARRLQAKRESSAQKPDASASKEAAAAAESDKAETSPLLANSAPKKPSLLARRLQAKRDSVTSTGGRETAEQGLANDSPSSAPLANHADPCLDASLAASSKPSLLTRRLQAKRNSVTSTGDQEASEQAAGTGSPFSVSPANHAESQCSETSPTAKARSSLLTRRLQAKRNSVASTIGDQEASEQVVGTSLSPANHAESQCSATSPTANAKPSLLTRRMQAKRNSVSSTGDHEAGTGPPSSASPANRAESHCSSPTANAKLSLLARRMQAKRNSVSSAGDHEAGTGPPSSASPANRAESHCSSPTANVKLSLLARRMQAKRNSVSSAGDQDAGTGSPSPVSHCSSPTANAKQSLLTRRLQAKRNSVSSAGDQDAGTGSASPVSHCSSPTANAKPSLLTRRLQAKRNSVSSAGDQDAGTGSPSPVSHCSSPTANAKQSLLTRRLQAKRNSVASAGDQEAGTGSPPSLSPTHRAEYQCSQTSPTASAKPSLLARRMQAKRNSVSSAGDQEAGTGPSSSVSPANHAESQCSETSPTANAKPSLLARRLQAKRDSVTSTGDQEPAESVAGTGPPPATPPPANTAEPRGSPAANSKPSLLTRRLQAKRDSVTGAPGAASGRAASAQEVREPGPPSPPAKAADEGQQFPAGSVSSEASAAAGSKPSLQTGQRDSVADAADDCERPEQGVSSSTSSKSSQQTGQRDPVSDAAADDCERFEHGVSAAASSKPSQQTGQRDPGTDANCERLEQRSDAESDRPEVSPTASSKASLLSRRLQAKRGGTADAPQDPEAVEKAAGAGLPPAENKRDAVASEPARRAAPSSPETSPTASTKQSLLARRLQAKQDSVTASPGDSAEPSPEQASGTGSPTSARGSETSPAADSKPSLLSRRLQAKQQHADDKDTSAADREASGQAAGGVSPSATEQANRAQPTGSGAFPAVNSKLSLLARRLQAKQKRSEAANAAPPGGAAAPEGPPASAVKEQAIGAAGPLGPESPPPADSKSSGSGEGLQTKQENADSNTCAPLDQESSRHEAGGVAVGPVQTDHPESSGVDTPPANSKPSAAAALVTKQEHTDDSNSAEAGDAARVSVLQKHPVGTGHLESSGVDTTSAANSKPSVAAEGLPTGQERAVSSTSAPLGQESSGQEAADAAPPSALKEHPVDPVQTDRPVSTGVGTSSEPSVSTGELQTKQEHTDSNTRAPFDEETSGQEAGNAAPSSALKEHPVDSVQTDHPESSGVDSSPTANSKPSLLARRLQAKQKQTADASAPAAASAAKGHTAADPASPEASPTAKSKPSLLERRLQAKQKRAGSQSEPEKDPNAPSPAAPAADEGNRDSAATPPAADPATPCGLTPRGTSSLLARRLQANKAVPAASPPGEQEASRACNVSSDLSTTDISSYTTNTTGAASHVRSAAEAHGEQPGEDAARAAQTDTSSQSARVDSGGTVRTETHDSAPAENDVDAGALVTSGQPPPPRGEQSPVPTSTLRAAGGAGANGGERSPPPAPESHTEESVRDVPAAHPAEDGAPPAGEPFGTAGGEGPPRRPNPDSVSSAAACAVPEECSSSEPAASRHAEHVGGPSAAWQYKKTRKRNAHPSTSSSASSTSSASSSHASTNALSDGRGKPDGSPAKQHPGRESAHELHDGDSSQRPQASSPRSTTGASADEHAARRPPASPGHTPKKGRWHQRGSQSSEDTPGTPPKSAPPIFAEEVGLLDTSYASSAAASVDNSRSRKQTKRVLAAAATMCCETDLRDADSSSITLPFGLNPNARGEAKPKRQSRRMVYRLEIEGDDEPWGHGSTIQANDFELPQQQQNPRQLPGKTGQKKRASPTARRAARKQRHWSDRQPARNFLSLTGPQQTQQQQQQQQHPPALKRVGSPEAGDWKTAELDDFGGISRVSELLQGNHEVSGLFLYHLSLPSKIVRDIDRSLDSSGSEAESHSGDDDSLCSLPRISSLLRHTESMTDLITSLEPSRSSPRVRDRLEGHRQVLEKILVGTPPALQKAMAQCDTALGRLIRDTSAPPLLNASARPSGDVRCYLDVEARAYQLGLVLRDIPLSAEAREVVQENYDRLINALPKVQDRLLIAVVEHVHAHEEAVHQVIDTIREEQRQLATSVTGIHHRPEVWHEVAALTEAFSREAALTAETKAALLRQRERLFYLYQHCTVERLQETSASAASLLDASAGLSKVMAVDLRIQKRILDDLRENLPQIAVLRLETIKSNIAHLDSVEAKIMDTAVDDVSAWPEEVEALLNTVQVLRSFPRELKRILSQHKKLPERAARLLGVHSRVYGNAKAIDTPKGRLCPDELANAIADEAQTLLLDEIDVKPDLLILLHEYTDLLESLKIEGKSERLFRAETMAGEPSVLEKWQPVKLCAVLEKVLAASKELLSKRDGFPQSVVDGLVKQDELVSKTHAVMKLYQQERCVSAVVGGEIDSVKFEELPHDVQTQVADYLQCLRGALYSKRVPVFKPSNKEIAEREREVRKLLAAPDCPPDVRHWLDLHRATLQAHLDQDEALQQQIKRVDILIQAGEDHADRPDIGCRLKCYRRLLQACVEKMRDQDDVGPVILSRVSSIESKEASSGGGSASGGAVAGGANGGPSALASSHNGGGMKRASLCKVLSSEVPDTVHASAGSFSLVPATKTRSFETDGPESARNLRKVSFGTSSTCRDDPPAHLSVHLSSPFANDAENGLTSPPMAARLARAEAIVLPGSPVSSSVPSPLNRTNSPPKQSSCSSADNSMHSSPVHGTRVRKLGHSPSLVMEGGLNKQLQSLLEIQQQNRDTIARRLHTGQIGGEVGNTLSAQVTARVYDLARGLSPASHRQFRRDPFASRSPKAAADTDASNSALVDDVSASLHAHSRRADAQDGAAVGDPQEMTRSVFDEQPPFAEGSVEDYFNSSSSPREGRRPTEPMLPVMQSSLFSPGPRAAAADDEDQASKCTGAGSTPISRSPSQVSSQARSNLATRRSSSVKSKHSSYSRPPISPRHLPSDPVLESELLTAAARLYHTSFRTSEAVSDTSYNLPASIRKPVTATIHGIDSVFADPSFHVKGRLPAFAAELQRFHGVLKDVLGEPDEADLDEVADDARDGVRELSEVLEVFAAKVAEKVAGKNAEDRVVRALEAASAGIKRGVSGCTSCSNDEGAELIAVASSDFLSSCPSGRKRAPPPVAAPISPLSTDRSTGYPTPESPKLPMSPRLSTCAPAPLPGQPAAASAVPRTDTGEIPPSHAKSSQALLTLPHGVSFEFYRSLTASQRRRLHEAVLADVCKVIGAPKNGVAIVQATPGSVVLGLEFDDPAHIGYQEQLQSLQASGKVHLSNTATALQELGWKPAGDDTVVNHSSTGTTSSTASSSVAYANPGVELSRSDSSTTSPEPQPLECTDDKKS
ncbi:hypothetical protein DIPPA_09226, partial [Diplonema papillatum]